MLIDGPDLTTTLTFLGMSARDIKMDKFSSALVRESAEGIRAPPKYESIQVMSMVRDALAMRGIPLEDT